MPMVNILEQTAPVCILQNIELSPEMALNSLKYNISIGSIALQKSKIY